MPAVTNIAIAAFYNRKPLTHGSFLLRLINWRVCNALGGVRPRFLNTRRRLAPSFRKRAHQIERNGVSFDRVSHRRDCDPFSLLNRHGFRADGVERSVVRTAGAVRAASAAVCGLCAVDAASCNASCAGRSYAGAT